MRKSIFSLLSAILLVGSAPAIVQAELNGGKNCAGCTVILALIEQTAQINSVSVT